MRGIILALAAVVVTGCSSADWLHGRWLHLSEEGKLVGCLEFKSDNTYRTFLQRRCDGKSEDLLSGKWQIKKGRLALKAHSPGAPVDLLVFSRRGKDEFLASGSSGSAGSYYRVATAAATEEIAQRLAKEGKLKIRELPADLGCTAYGKSLGDVRTLPKDPQPRLLRKTDANLSLHAEVPAPGGDFAKITYAADQDRLIWVAWELSEAAATSNVIAQRVQASLGTPATTIKIGDGPEGQVIAGWKTYCRDLHGQAMVDVDLTLFATPGQKRGTLYLSDGSVGKLWPTFEKLAEEAGK